MPPANDDYRKRLAERKRLLARESQKRQREKAFSTPAPARFGVETDTKQDRVTDFGKPFESSLLTTNQTAKTIDRFASQMARRYSINPIKSARDVVQDTISGDEGGLKTGPKWLGLIPGLGIGGAMVQYNLLGNEKVSDVIAPADFLGASGILRGIGRAATSKAGKAALGTIGAGLGFGAANTETAEAAPSTSIARASGKFVLDPGQVRAAADIADETGRFVDDATKGIKENTEELFNKLNKIEEYSPEIQESIIADVMDTAPEWLVEATKNKPINEVKRIIRETATEAGEDLVKTLSDEGIDPRNILVAANMGIDDVSRIDPLFQNALDAITGVRFGYRSPDEIQKAAVRTMTDPNRWESLGDFMRGRGAGTLFTPSFLSRLSPADLTATDVTLPELNTIIDTLREGRRLPDQIITNLKGATDEVEHALTVGGSERGLLALDEAGKMSKKAASQVPEYIKAVQKEGTKLPKPVNQLLASLPRFARNKAGVFVPEGSEAVSTFKAYAPEQFERLEAAGYLDFMRGVAERTTKAAPDLTDALFDLMNTDSFIKAMQARRRLSPESLYIWG